MNTTIAMDFSVTSQMEDNVHAKYMVEDEETPPSERPHFLTMTPVFRGLHRGHEKDDGIVGFLLGVVPFDYFMGDLLPQGVVGINVQIRNTCDQDFVYKIVGAKVRRIRRRHSGMAHFVLP